MGDIQMFSNGHVTKEDAEEDDYTDDVTEPFTKTAEDGAHPRDEQCGLGAWRPSWLQCGANIQAFTVVLSLWSLSGGINFTYFTAVITQIERQFGLSSSMMGFLKNVDNFGYIATVLIFSHFFRYSNKPRLFACCTVISSVAIFIFALPYFVYGTDELPEIPVQNASNPMRMKPGAKSTEMCDGLTQENTEQFCRSSGARAFNVGALVMFIISEVLQGIAQSPKMTLTLTYMDDNAKDKSPRYFAFMFSMRAFAPVVGFMMGAWTTSIYVDLSDPGLSPKDPQWIGAWWLGFVICAGISIIWAVPMLLFPPVLRGGDRVVDTNQGESVLEKFKEMPKAMARLAKNRLYMLLVLALCFEIYLMGFFTFLPKYLEQYFGVTASLASMLTGAAAAIGFALGPVVSGFLVTLKKTITPTNSLKIVCIITGLSVIGQLVLTLISCPESEWAGNINRNDPDLRLECNGNCSCDALSFNPVCGEGINYYSPCHAGCKEEIKENGTTIYTGCQCIPGGVAQDGVCPKQCGNSMYFYIVVLFLTKFIGAMDIIPNMTLFMRTVHQRDKAIALATVGLVLQIMVFPAPIVYGKLVDSACLVLQGGCARRSRRRGGACLLYDETDLRLRIHVFSTVMKGVAFLIYLVALYISKNYQYHSQEPDAEKQLGHKEEIGAGVEEVEDSPKHKLILHESLTAL